MIKVGITGGIGSGKTTVCGLFETLGIPVYYADSQAKNLMTQDPKLRHQIMDLIGPHAYTAEGKLNRAVIANQVFSDEDMLKRLNQLVHPAVARHSELWTKAHMDAPYTIQEAALHYESGGYQRMDIMIVVTAPEDVRIARVMARDHVSATQVRSRMNNQWPEIKKVEKADFVIRNNHQIGLIKQVWNVHRAILSKV